MVAPQLITQPEQLEALVERVSRAKRIALDSEGNGLHAYRSKLCVLQIGWENDGDFDIAIVDVLALEMDPLGPVLGSDGPLKVLHDLTFDARMLDERGLVLDNIRDTSVAARFLGIAATGLASLVKARFDVKMSKRLQEHNWAERPFTAAQLEYLAGDVVHLLELDTQLAVEADEAGINEEIAEECAYKLMTAARPPKDTRPPWARIKGYRGLGEQERAILRSLVVAREDIAARLDRPPFKIASNAMLFEIAKRKPQREDQLRRMFKRGRSGRWARDWMAAIQRGLSNNAPSEPPPPSAPYMSRREVDLRKSIDSAILKWRKKAAVARKVDLQVVLPGHCVTGVVAALANDTSLEDVEGLGRKRIDMYADAWRTLAAAAVASD